MFPYHHNTSVCTSAITIHTYMYTKTTGMGLSHQPHDIYKSALVEGCTHELTQLETNWPTTKCKINA